MKEECKRTGLSKYERVCIVLVSIIRAHPILLKRLDTGQSVSGFGSICRNNCLRGATCACGTPKLLTVHPLVLASRPAPSQSSAAHVSERCAVGVVLRNLRRVRRVGAIQFCSVGQLVQEIPLHILFLPLHTQQAVSTFRQNPTTRIANRVAGAE